jgi:hypothetical protein
LIALAFVPPSDVVSDFEEVDQSPFFQTNRVLLDEYLDYFSRTWIGGFDRRGVRKTPLFPISLWNCHASVLADLPKTNNFCEGFHSGFLSLISYQHPTLPKFVAGLLKQQTLTSFRLELFNAAQLPPLRPKLLKQTAKLKSAVRRYGTIPNLDYLRGVAHCFKF